jgi:hypothetical protein
MVDGGSPLTVEFGRVPGPPSPLPMSSSRGAPTPTKPG